MFVRVIVTRVIPVYNLVKKIKTTQKYLMMHAWKILFLRYLLIYDHLNKYWWQQQFAIGISGSDFIIYY